MNRTSANGRGLPSLCANCGARLAGPMCHQCGQAARSPLRGISALLEDLLDTVLGWDNRLLRTLLPLLLRPGFLTLEYFAGRRIRYLPPFRTMFLLSALAFLVIQFNISHFSDRDATAGAPVQTSFADADSATEVNQELDRVLAGIAEARSTTGGALGGLLDTAADEARRAAATRIADLATNASTGGAAAPAQLARHAAGPDPAPASSAVADEGLLDSTLQGDTRRDEQLVAGIFRALPPAMVLLLPVFAGLLKLTYLFKRRLYVEHLVVAVHIHAFLFLALLLASLLSLLGDWLRPVAGWLQLPLAILVGALWLWSLVYLLLMQKRIYRQGWIATGIKYLCVGTCYTVLLGITILGALIFAAKDL